MVGGRHLQLCPKRGKLLSGVGFAEMVCCQGVLAPKLCTIYPSHRTGIGGGSKVNGGNPVRGPQCKAKGTAILQGVRSINGAGRQRAGRHGSPLHAEETVQRCGKLDVPDEERRKTGDRGGANPLLARIGTTSPTRG